MQNKSDTKVLTTTIPNGQATSLAVDIGVGYALVGLDIIGSWTPADLCYECSSIKNGDGTFNPTAFLRVQDATGTVVRVQGVAANVSITERALDILVRRYVKLRSIAVGGSADVNQGAERTINIIVKSVIG